MPPGGAASTLHQQRARIPQIIQELEVRLETGNLPLVGLSTPESIRRVRRLTNDEAGPSERWFFIGDIHGDFYALHTLIAHAEMADPDCCICFLGDIVDRGHMPFECMYLLLDWGLQHPGRLAWIAGNHDIAYRKVNGRFVSTCSPAESTEDFNRDAGAGLRGRSGDFFIRLTNLLPRALLFPDGLLATHGGMPHTDLQKRAADILDEGAFLDWLNSDECLRDFTWNRISRYPRKQPDRHSSGPQYGYRDFEAFCDLTRQWFPVTAMVTGHEHAEGGADTNPTYEKHPVLTLLGQGFDDTIDRGSKSFYVQYREVLRMGRGRTGSAPDVMDVPVIHADVAIVYREHLAPEASAGLSSTKEA